MLVGFFGTLYFLGFLISSLFFPPLSDKIGRLKMFLIGSVVQLFTFLIMLYVKNLSVQYLMVFILGLSQPVKSMIAYTHLMEFMTDRESRVSGTFMCIDGLVYVVSPLIDEYLTNDLNFFIQVAATLCFISIIIFKIIKVPESMKFLLVNGKSEEFWKAFESLQRYNKAAESKVEELRKLVANY